MKMKNLLIAGTLFVSLMVSAQKDELKTLKKIYSKERPSASDITDYKAALAKLESSATEEGDKVYYGFYKAILPTVEMSTSATPPTQLQMQKIFTSGVVVGIADAARETLDYEKKSGKKLLSDDINEDLKEAMPMFTNLALALNKVGKDADAARVMYAVYKLDPKNLNNLFYAASFAVNGKDYELALKNYQELKSMNYSGEETAYYAKNKASGEEEYFQSKNQRDEYVRLGSHEKARDEKLPSKRGEIYRNIALILVQQGKKEEAKQAFADARRANPKDESLLLGEANLYLELNDNENYTRLVNEALANNPNNVDLLFNLGVVSAKANQLDAAEGYYRKAIELKPDYFNAYLNLAELKLRGDQKYVDEINKLGTTDKELKRYEVLKTERNKNFTAILPLVEKAYELKPEDEGAKKTLMSLYNALEMTDKYKALKAKK